MKNGLLRRLFSLALVLVMLGSMVPMASAEGENATCTCTQLCDVDAGMNDQCAICANGGQCTPTTQNPPPADDSDPNSSTHVQCTNETYGADCVLEDGHDGDCQAECGCTFVGGHVAPCEFAQIDDLGEGGEPTSSVTLSQGQPYINDGAGSERVYLEILGLNTLTDTEITSLQVKLYTEGGQEIAVNTLVPGADESLNTTYKLATLGCCFWVTNTTDCWQTNWGATGPVANMVPAKATLFVNTTEMASNTILMRDIDNLGDATQYYTWGAIPGVNIAKSDNGGTVTYHTTLADAIAAGGTVTLLGDTNVTESIVVTKDVVLDLNGKTINYNISTNGTYKRLFEIESGCTSFMLNGGTNGKITNATADGFGIIRISAPATVTVNGGIYNFNTADGGQFIRNNEGGANVSTVILNAPSVTTNNWILDGSAHSFKSLTVSGGTYTTSGSAVAVDIIESATFLNAAITGNAMGVEVSGTNAATATFEGCTIISNGQAIGGSGMTGYSVGVSDDIQVTIKSGSYSGTRTGLTSSGTSMTIEGGSFTGPISLHNVNGALTIKNGTFTNFAIEDNGTGSAASISGGTFDAEVPAKHCASGYKCVENGEGIYTVKPMVFVAQIGSGEDAIKYESLQEAVNAANSGDTITLLDHVALADNTALSIPAGVTLDLNTKTLTVNGESGILGNGAALKNGTVSITTYDGDTVADGLFKVADGESVSITDVNFTSESLKIHSLFHLNSSGTVNITGGSIKLNNNGSDGMIFYGNGTNAIVNINGTTIECENVGDGFSNTTANLTNSTVKLTGTNGGLDNGFNGTKLILDNTDVTIDGAGGRGITLNGSECTVKNGSNVTISNCAEGDVMFRSSHSLIVDDSSSLTRCHVLNQGAVVGKINDKTVSGTADKPNFATVKDGITTIETYAVAVDIDGNRYESLERVFAQDGSYTLIMDINKPDTLFTNTKNVTIDLKNYTIYTSGIMNNGTLKLSNGSIVDTTFDNSGIETTVSLTLENVNVTSARHAIRASGGDTEITGGVFQITSKSGTLHCINVGGDGVAANVTINDGTFTARNNSVEASCVINAQSKANVTINGGTFSKFVQNFMKCANDATIAISGGSFEDDPSKYLTEGSCFVLANGMYEVSKITWTEYPETAGDCQNQKQTAHYKCNVCGKFFGTQAASGHSTTGLETNAGFLLGLQDHNYKKVELVAANCTEGGCAEHYECETCDKWFSLNNDGETYTEITDKDSLKTDPNPNGHVSDDPIETPANCVETGLNRHFACEKCEKLFIKNNDGTQTIVTPEDLIVPVDPTVHKGPVQKVDGKSPTYCTTGIMEYYICEACGTITDESGTPLLNGEGKPATPEDMIIPAQNNGKVINPGFVPEVLYIANVDPSLKAIGMWRDDLAEMEELTIVSADGASIYFNETALQKITDVNCQIIYLHVDVDEDGSNLNATQKANIRGMGMVTNKVITVGLSCEHGSAHIPTGFGGKNVEITVNINVNSGFKLNDYYAIHVDDAGKIDTKISETRSGSNTMTIRAEHFSDYVIVRDKKEASSAATGDAFNVMLWVGVAVAAAAVLVVMLLLLRKSEKKGKFYR